MQVSWSIYCCDAANLVTLFGFPVESFAPDAGSFCTFLSLSRGG